MSKPLIVMALEAEGQGQLESMGYEILYCGVGKVNAAYHLTKKLHKDYMSGKTISYILNLGSAGSPTFNSGTLVAANCFIQRDMDATGLGFSHGETPFDNSPGTIEFPKHFEHLPHGVCGSGDSFLQVPSPIPCDIIDMEAYSLAKICLLEGRPFVCVKYITDGADHKASSDWQSNLKHAADAFYKLLALQAE